MDLVKAFSKMLDSIPHDQIFTQLIINQIVTYYDKCCGWYKGEKLLSFLLGFKANRPFLYVALVTRMSPGTAGGIRLKSAAAYAESGEIRDITNGLWKSAAGAREELIQKVITLYYLFRYYGASNTASKLTFWYNSQTKRHWNHSTWYQIQKQSLHSRYYTIAW
jgi:hypothetical protein